MRKNCFLYCLFAGILLFVISCKPDEEVKSNGVCDDLLAPGQTCPAPTPYNFIPPSTLPQVALPINNPLTVEGIYLGRLLFYDPILSLDSTQSCASCHKQENAFADPDQFSTGITGQLGRRNSMALFNLLWQKNGFFWDGRATTLQEQVSKPVTDPIEMAHATFCGALKELRKSEFYREHFCKAFGDDEITQARYENALEQFLVTLVSDDSKYDKLQRGESGPLSTDAFFGSGLFNNEAPAGADCFHCHSASVFGTYEYINNGLDSVLTDFGRYEFTEKEADKGKFKVPSLRNIALTAPYMHDGRFNTLEEVIDFYSEGVNANSPNLDPLMFHHGTGVKLNLTALEKKQLKAYLLALSDSSFIANPAFANPFK